MHPAFCGGFADRSDPAAVIIRPGYADGHWTKSSWTDQGVRAKVGAGLSCVGFDEGGRPTPTTFSVRAVKPG